MKAINRAELKTMNETEKEDFVLINVVSTTAFNEKHIRTSVNVPSNDGIFTNRVESIAGSKNRKVVLYCDNFGCNASEEAAYELEAAGFSQVYDYAGGTEDWFEHKAHR